MLTLPIKGLWFHKIKKGLKLEEYREIKPYYDTRFKNVWKGKYSEPKWVRLRKGYKGTSPELYIRCTLSIGRGRQEWGAEPRKDYYILRILEVSEDNPMKGEAADFFAG